MKAVVCKALGGPEKLVVEELPSPRPGPGQVLVRVAAAGVNFPDTLIIQGKYQFKATPPFTPGAEFCGKVRALGEGVSGLQIGEAVVGIVTWGAFAQEIVVDAHRVMPVPASGDPQLIAGFGLTYSTSYHALKDRANLQKGESVLVLGAAGGVGLAAVELAKLMGATVIAAASSEEKLATCKRFGADHLVNYERDDLREAIKSITAGRGVDVVYDPVGDRFSEPAFRSLAWRGRHLVVGFAAGDIPKLPLNLALLKGASLVGVFWGDFNKREPELSAANIQQLVRWLLGGQLKPLISATYPLERAGEALQAIAERRAQGKLVITMG